MGVYVVASGAKRPANLEANPTRFRSEMLPAEAGDGGGVLSQMERLLELALWRWRDSARRR